jgi:hypothetical protein
MANINTQTKGPKGVQIKESLIPGGSSGFTRGLAVIYGADVYHAAVASVANSACIGIIEEDAVSTTEAIAVIEFGQAVAQVGAAIASAPLALTNNSTGQLVPATAGQTVVAIALETTPNAGDYICVFVPGLFGLVAAIA